MKVGMIGLGKMGLNLALNLQENNIDVVGYDVSTQAREKASESHLSIKNSQEELLQSLEGKKIIFLSTPAGEITNTLVKTLCDQLQSGDILIDGGNSYFKDSVKNYEQAKEKGIGFLDCGTSGGMEGAQNGACLMIGGDADVFNQTEEIFAALACDQGYLYAGESGSGHYLKMIHNGIEYGMMQAIGEGFDILNAGGYDYDFEKVASVWNHGSVIRSWLMELAEESFKSDPRLDDIKGIVDVSGEGKWTVAEALDLNVPVPVISSSLFARNASKIDDSFSAKVVATMRNQFGGHEVMRKEGP
ncbi:decarboxylating 6-phosphogluconate dehydrogenase [Carnobacterium sp. CS13]|uniref:phosphogluconate dehydrogenase (NAD(+)-dependent, decarboxylating) n=1 Tax=Carnobacterium sp. CS13 TaxID=2800128 RepID=UPI0019124913|nr:decarboxylating 6-phosphogluconate dehydrogenase [Carnobacterium sp. CS13]QQP69533.1 decarboxylating 6-phosphogluconate dehydrogenase [Carnobacterium sp. CS13]